LMFNLGVFIFNLLYDLVFRDVDFSFHLYLLISQFVINATVAFLMYLPMANINYLKSE
jgi:hypothetical protein